eukprot:scaffold42007_cov75-Phaeocystis_antarctica.AAC.3
MGPKTDVASGGPAARVRDRERAALCRCVCCTLAHMSMQRAVPRTPVSRHQSVLTSHISARNARAGV